MELIVR